MFGPFELLPLTRPDAVLPFDGFTIVFVIGLLYSLMPLTVWTILHGRHDRLSTALWCWGALASGLGFLMVGLRTVLPHVLAFELAAFVGYTGTAMRWASLRRERGSPTRAGRAATVVALAAVGYGVGDMVNDLLRMSFHLLALAAGSALIAVEGCQLAQGQRSRSARLLAWAYGALAAALLMRCVSLLMGMAVDPPFSLGPDSALLLGVGLVTALWGNVGYLGMALERARQEEVARRAELDAEIVQRARAEEQAQALQQLSEERQELLRVVAHEVRQPLHNAQAVLQGVESTLQREVAEGDAAGQRIARARTVLRQITASLDNVLAASTVLVGERPTLLHDADIDMLLDLVLGDLPPTAAPRVRIVRDSEIRTAALDMGLMRLALRNLLINALAYSLPGSQVTLRLADSDDPLAIVFEVGDVGPGIPQDLLPRLFERGARGRHDVPGQGLGLYIVRQAMRRQGGRVEVRSSGNGTVFTLHLPQGVEPA